MFLESERRENINQKFKIQSKVGSNQIYLPSFLQINLKVN
jgi:hypothetical protein